MSFFQQSLDFSNPTKRQEPEEDEPIVWSVADLTRRVRDLLEMEFGEVWVEGEITNHRRQASGHHYFALKDEDAQLSCVLFRGSAGGAKGVEMRDGTQVRVFGNLTVYEVRGQYQLVVRKVQPRGQGALQARFEALKAKLQDEGLFATERKRELPQFPARVGLVTSPTGAAVRDFLRTLAPRFPTEVVLRPVRVQGKGAASEIAAALDAFSKPESPEMAVDVIVLVRGGGSLEDLWEFNEEVVARAVAAASVPVVVGVGHEIDFTIADFAADYRAATPTAAAAAILPEREEVQRILAQHSRRLQRDASASVALLQARLLQLSQAGVFREPIRAIEKGRLAVDWQLERLGGGTRQRLEQLRGALVEMRGRLRALHPQVRLEMSRQSLARAAERLEAAVNIGLDSRRRRFERLEVALKAYSPESTLERGYSITLDREGNLVDSAKAVQRDDEITTVLKGGKLTSVVKRIEQQDADDKD